jgi:hypothetical protein
MHAFGGVGSMQYQDPLGSRKAHELVQDIIAIERSSGYLEAEACTSVDALLPLSPRMILNTWRALLRKHMSQNAARISVNNFRFSANDDILRACYRQEEMASFTAPCLGRIFPKEINDLNDWGKSTSFQVRSCSLLKYKPTKLTLVQS